MLVRDKIRGTKLKILFNTDHCNKTIAFMMMSF